jgi:hypothetical protein
MKAYRSDLKKAFWPNLFVGASFQLLNPACGGTSDLPRHRRGLKHSPAATLSQNPIFEVAPIASPQNIYIFMKL